MNLALFLFLAAGTVPGPAVGVAHGTADSLPRISWSPEEPAQGTLFLVQVQTPPGSRPLKLEGTAGREALHFREVEPGRYASLAAVPVDVRGGLPVRVTATLADGARSVVEADVPVGAGDFSFEELKVAPRFGAPPDSAMQARLARDRARAARVSRRAHATPPLWTDAVVRPRPGPVTSGFGNGRTFNGRISSRHMGLDLRGAPGDTVVAAARGVVEMADAFVLAGNVVYINHGGGLLSGYFHLSEQLVAEGDTVEAGTPVGLVGATGRVTGPHLHWVVRYGRTSVDPRSLLKVAGGQGEAEAGVKIR
ncbi:MAG: M23 family metallopeptidase [Gemmatimonadota bacterium]